MPGEWTMMADPEESESGALRRPCGAHPLPKWARYLAVAVVMLALAVFAGRDEALSRHAADPYRLPEDAMGAFWMKVSAMVLVAEALFVGTVVLLRSHLGGATKAVGCLAVLAGFALLGFLIFNLYFATFAAN